GRPRARDHPGLVATGPGYERPRRRAAIKGSPEGRRFHRSANALPDVGPGRPSLREEGVGRPLLAHHGGNHVSPVPPLLLWPRVRRPELRPGRARPSPRIVAVLLWAGWESTANGDRTS